MDARQQPPVSSSSSYTANDWTRNLSRRQILPNPHARISQHSTSSMFNKILIANRGEIAVRIIRACREPAIPSVAVFSEADRASLHVRLADEAYPIGAAPTRESYLHIDKLIDVARRSGCDAIHPGYGFRAEDPAFPRACEETNLVFIRSEEHTSELQSLRHLVCRLLLEKKKKKPTTRTSVRQPV